MRIRALPISEWSTGEVCGHVCKRGSRNRRVSGICVVSTLAVCVRSTSTQGQMTCPVGGGALPTARMVPRGSNSSTHTRRAPAQQHRGVSVASQLVCCSLRQTSAGYWPPSIHGEPLARVSPEAIDGRERPLARTYSSGPTDGARGRSRAVQLWPV